MNSRVIGGVVTVVVLAVIIGVFATRSSSQTPEVRAVTDVAEDGTEYAVQHTFLCTLPGGREARDWHFTDRWVKNQLSYDTYHAGGVAGGTVVAIQRVSSVNSGHVRFRRERLSLSGSSLEGHDYLRVRINGEVATIEEDVLFVEHNVNLEPPPATLPACGTPRS
ncbi:MAG: hypothetical protein A3B86_01375 [Candidatus Yanofskybacteria bacterium RIFCSPHIGHO2_02_FULL_38_22b]|uniref:Uncharacterized protein n=1 Tax=Candidatus Yanofskybacteria bacterium RIFCSPHIGHO2_02_FULL_38_22b TaxID=1802673 RepID=A0A1F8F2N9_9BACT|nr:MAG: hypothetical protein A3B86_01375 [Candidatus Yanofskybacteria bacterium RIFCSPHIGHO2_02_FULL_38_22b]OGN20463.1 MAG: hypothetical protein A2910_02230 [Candidatus Yanofskybacteria bacterium RIFCSPLOWO2_01_FULL_39_28]